MIRISQVKVPLEHDAAVIKKAAAAKIRVPEREILDMVIIKQSLDARSSTRSGHPKEICYQYTVAVSLKNEERVLRRHMKDVQKYDPVIYQFPFHASSTADQERPVIIGTGPAGLFCGLVLARAGFRPILLERGSSVRERMRKVNEFWNGGPLDPQCNVQFGEGGAGTFSDGKLNTLIKDPSGRHAFVLKCFVRAGAPEEILYVQKPHIGTDALVEIVENIRNEIIRLGGEFHFDSCVTDLIIEGSTLKGLVINHKKQLQTKCAVLAPGHSARDTYQMLLERKLTITPKAFAIGVRIEHPQEMIGMSQYGPVYRDLPAASYKLTHRADNGRNVYTFCMCPGGYVVNASSEEGRTVVNGMSLHDRAGDNANSAVIVNVVPEDFGSDHPLAGVEFQRRWESLAYREGRGSVPVQLFKDFEAGVVSEAYGDIRPAHKGAVKFGDLNHCLPDYVCAGLKDGIRAFGKKIRGFDREDALLSGVETRSSSPVRIERDDSCSSNIRGIYPCGEGAGYAGGITSAAIDGIRVAEAVARQLGGTQNDNKQEASYADC